LIYIDSDAQTQEPTLPMQVAQEIQLFLFPQTIIMQPTSTQMISIHSTRYGDNYMFIHTSGVFHPPSFA
jgi:topoisomerase IA-like protein